MSEAFAKLLAKFERPSQTKTPAAVASIASTAVAAGSTARTEVAVVQPELDATQPAEAADASVEGPVAPAAAAAVAAGTSSSSGPAGAACKSTVKVARGHYDILRGTLDPDNPLALLRGNEHMWSDIFGRVDDWYKQHINRDCVAYQVFRRQPGIPLRTPLMFPEPEGLNINMMPIRMFRRDTIPEMCSQYHDMIKACLMPRGQAGRVAYLTIQECHVPVGEAQRRPGLHIESPRSIIADGGKMLPPHLHSPDEYYMSVGWGGGTWDTKVDLPVGGIYMASNVANSTRVWPVLIENPVEVTDGHGGIEHMLERLGEGKDIEANELCWFTDRTPHESLPLRAPAQNPNATHVYRQFFRLVVGKIDVWYSKHNTPNPLGVLPNARVSNVDKFATAAPSASASALS